MAADTAEPSRLLAAGQFDAALSLCDRALQASRGSPPLWQIKVRALEGLRRWPEYARAVFDGSAAFPEDVELGLRAAQLYIGQKDHGKARQAIERLPEQVLGMPMGALLFAQSLWGDGHYASAIDHFQRAVELDASDSRGQLALVRAQLSLGQRAVALKQLTAFRERDSEDPNALFMATLAKISESKPTELQTAFHKVLASAPGHQLARCGAYLTYVLGGSQGRSELPGFPATPLERAQKDAIDTLVTAGANVVPFPTDVLLRALDKSPATGLIMEFGVFHGRSLNLIAANSERPIFGFDSFAGLPEPWGEEPAGAYSTQGRMPAVPDHVTLVDGWFEDTLPPFAAKHGNTPVAFVHVDCDLYSSTRCILTHLEPQIVPGTVFVFDDYLGIPSARDHEFRAWNEFADDHGISFDYLEFTALGREASLVVTRRG